MMAQVLFYLFAILTCASAIGVVASHSIVRTAMCLLFALLGVAGLYFMLHAEFLAAVQLVVYVGGTLVLIIFGVMLTARVGAQGYQASKLERGIAGIIGLILFVALTAALTKAKFPNHPLGVDDYPLARLGQDLLTTYLAPFELVSVLLLAVMIGAAYLARRRKEDRHG